MALQLVVESLEAVAAEDQKYYTQLDDGTFKLSVEGIEDTKGLKSALEKEREKNKKVESEIQKMRDALKNFEGIDPEVIKKNAELLSKIEEKKLLEAGDLEQVVEKRTENMRSEYKKNVDKLNSKVQELEQHNKTLEKEMSTFVLQHAILNAVNSVAVPRKEALEDIVARGMREWELNENRVPVTRGKDGEVIYGKDGTGPLRLEEWASQLAERTPFYFLDSKGGGASGSRPNDRGMIPQSVLDSLSPTQKMAAGRNLQAV